MVWIDLLYGLAFVGGTIALALGTYAAARVVAVPRMGEDTKDLAGSMVFRVGALHGLILALVFAQELVQYRTLRIDLAREASALTDIHYDLARYGGAAVEVRPLAHRYAELAVGPEWESLGRADTLLEEGWRIWGALYEAVLDLEPRTSREESLRAAMLVDIHVVSELRDRRESVANTAVGLPFWVAALAGVVLVVLPYFPFAPKPLNLLLLGIFAGYTGLVLSFTYAFSDPFSAPGLLAPADLERMLATAMAR